MRLKKIAIFGFKSFADKTVLHFDSGITCIVGPNGCGKSNIADAFRWVLGEQSAKSMRGTKMPDVIFAGATHRKPLNFAEVSLTLTDVQGALPLDYEEITISRRLHRSGESEYLLNGNAVRLKDLQTLFLGSGVGRNAFSIFEQGKLDQVISFTPQERRHIFEEAAGILRFLQRKKEALKRLEMADLNLSRVCDIHKEVEKQMRTLEAQAKAASIFKASQAELEMLEKASYVHRLHGMQKKQEDLQFKHKEKQNKLEECRIASGQHLAKCREANLAKDNYEKAKRSLSEQLLSFQSKQEIRANECASFQLRLKEIEGRERKLKQEAEDLSLARKSRKKTLEELEGRRRLLESQSSDAEQALGHQVERLRAQEMEVAALRQSAGEMQKAHLKSLHQNSQQQSDLKQAEVRLENLEENQKNLSCRKQQLISDRELLAKSVQEKKMSLQKISELVDSHKDRLEHYGDELKQLSLEGEKKQKELELLQRKFMEIKARQNVLLRMREENEGFSSGSKRLLQEAENQESPFFQKLRPLYEFIIPESEIAEALAVSLRSYSQTLVAENECDAKAALSFAEQSELQDYSLFCLDWVQEGKNPCLQEKLPLLGRMEENPVSRHFLQSIELEPSNLKALHSWITGKSLGKSLECWSSEGGFIDHRGVMFKIKPSENQVFMRESELNAQEAEISSKEEEIAKCEQALQHLQKLRARIQGEREEADKILRRDEMKLVEVNFGLQRAISDLGKNQADQLQCENELIALKDNIENQSNAAQNLKKQFEEGKRELDFQQLTQEALNQELKGKESALRIQEADQKQKGSLSLQLAQSLQQLIHQCNLLEAKELDFENSSQRIEDELSESGDKKIQIKQEEANARKVLALLEEQVQGVAKSHADLEIKGQGFLNECEKADRGLATLQETLKGIEHELAQLDIQLAHQRAISQAVAEELSERFNLTMEESDSLVLPLGQSLDQTEKRVKELRQVIKNLGDVNLAAIDDLDQHLVRYEFLKGQMADLAQSKDELLGMVEQLEGESHKLFKETFEAIRVNFRKNFQILFNGGEADLQFTDSKDIMEAGIEIIASPPGKQMRTIGLLSGGEKCLTAVALLFAIFEFKPAPFCILDEIDAPLDDANVDRFANVVKHFAPLCQFLIITHNKRTMAIGDTLFGVTMEERGVSKLLSLEFTQGSDVPEAALVS